MKQYKVGDKVRIKKRVGNGDDYPLGFVDPMTDRSGEICTISAIKETSTDMSKYGFFNGDCHFYKIKEDNSNFTWHSSMFEPVESDQHLSGPGRGSKITVGNFTGKISQNLSNKWYVFFDDTVKHAKICKTLHDDINSFFTLAKAFGALRHSVPTCFPCFESLESLLQFVEALNERLTDKASNSLKIGDPIWIGETKGIIDCTGSSHYVMFKPDSHCATCTKLRELIPNFDSLAAEYGTTSTTCPKDCFPAFPTLEKLLQFIGVINNQLHNPQKLQKDENRLQKQKTSFRRGAVPTGHSISGRRHKTSVTVGCLSHKTISC